MIYIASNFEMSTSSKGGSSEKEANLRIATVVAHTNEMELLVDSGKSQHITNDLNHFVQVEDIDHLWIIHFSLLERKIWCVWSFSR